MDEDIQEIREKIDELTEMVKENSRMTKSVYRQARFASLVVFIKWVIIIGAAVGAFYYLQPYLETLTKTYATITHLAGSVPSTTATSSSSGFVDFIKNNF